MTAASQRVEECAKAIGTKLIERPANLPSDGLDNIQLENLARVWHRSFRVDAANNYDQPLQSPEHPEGLP